MKLAFILLLTFVYAFVSVKYSVAVIKTPVLSTGRKVINVILIWLLPFFWAMLIRQVLVLKNSGSYEIDIKNDVSSNNFYESGKGRPGGGIGFR